MAPPGAVPPGYSSDHIPPAYMQKQPVPEGLDTNTRAYTIFFGYLGFCAGLTLFIVHRLLKSYNVLYKSRTARPPPRRHVNTFAALAIGSLATTWYYMFRYFYVSYQIWLMWRSYYELSPDMNHWGLWLRDTALYKDAWEIAIVGSARYFWTHQIFFFACGLGIYLEQKGIPRNIKHTWAFMLLGQIVAVSFATNLFLLAVLLSPPEPAPTSGVRKSSWLGPWVVNLLAILATEFSTYHLADKYYWHSKEFMTLLLLPHLALMAWPVARAVVPAKYYTDDHLGPAKGVYKYLWGTTIMGGAMLWLKIFIDCYKFSGIRGISDAILEHPAVSSIAFDVVFCYITWIAWFKTQSGGPGLIIGEKEADEQSWDGAGSGTTVSGGDDNGAVRRR